MAELGGREIGLAERQPRGPSQRPEPVSRERSGCKREIGNMRDRGER